MKLTQAQTINPNPKERELDSKNSMSDNKSIVAARSITEDVAGTVQMAEADIETLTQNNFMALQNTIGNEAICQMMSNMNSSSNENTLQRMKINKKGESAMFGDYNTNNLGSFASWLCTLGEAVLNKVIITLSSKQTRDENEETALGYARVLLLRTKPGRLCTMKETGRTVLKEGFQPSPQEALDGIYCVDTQTEDGITDYYTTQEVFPQVTLGKIQKTLEQREKLPKEKRKSVPLPKGRLCRMNEGQKEVLEENFVPPAEAYDNGEFWIDLQTEDGVPDWYLGL